MGKLQSLSDLKAQYGRPETEFLDTGNFLLNSLMGGGLPTGKFVEFHGMEGCGKTTIIVQFLKYMIGKLDMKAMYMDVEAALDYALRESIGITEFEHGDDPSFWYSCPGTYAEIAKVMLAFLKSDYQVLVWDSIANSSVEINEDDDAKGMISEKLGQDALEQTRLLKAFRNKFGRYGKTLIIVNQMRSNISTNSWAAKFQPDFKPAGGKAYDHNLDIRFAISTGKWIELEKERVGRELSLTTIKNKVTSPFRKVNADLYFGKGIDRISALYSVVISKGIAKMGGGGYYTIEGLDEPKVQGKEALKQLVRDRFHDIVRLVNEAGELGERVDVKGEQAKDAN